MRVCLSAIRHSFIFTFLCCLTPNPLADLWRQDKEWLPARIKISTSSEGDVKVEQGDHLTSGAVEGDDHEEACYVLVSVISLVNTSDKSGHLVLHAWGENGYGSNHKDKTVFAAGKEISITC
jgi:hypothetical protein